MLGGALFMELVRGIVLHGEGGLVARVDRSLRRAPAVLHERAGPADHPLIDQVPVLQLVQHVVSFSTSMNKRLG